MVPHNLILYYSLAHPGKYQKIVPDFNQAPQPVKEPKRIVQKYLQEEAVAKDRLYTEQDWQNRYHKKKKNKKVKGSAAVASPNNPGYSITTTTTTGTGTTCDLFHMAAIQVLSDKTLQKRKKGQEMVMNGATTTTMTTAPRPSTLYHPQLSCTSAIKRHVASLCKSQRPRSAPSPPRVASLRTRSSRATSTDDDENEDEEEEEESEEEPPLHPKEFMVSKSRAKSRRSIIRQERGEGGILDFSEQLHNKPLCFLISLVYYHYELPLLLSFLFLRNL